MNSPVLKETICIETISYKHNNVGISILSLVNGIYTSATNIIKTGTILSKIKYMELLQFYRKLRYINRNYYVTGP